MQLWAKTKSLIHTCDVESAFSALYLDMGVLLCKSSDLNTVKLVINPLIVMLDSQTFVRGMLDCLQDLTRRSKWVNQVAYKAGNKTPRGRGISGRLKNSYFLLLEPVSMHWPFIFESQIGSHFGHCLCDWNWYFSCDTWQEVIKNRTMLRHKFELMRSVACSGKASWGNCWSEYRMSHRHGTTSFHGHTCLWRSIYTQCGHWSSCSISQYWYTKNPGCAYLL